MGTSANERFNFNDSLQKTIDAERKRAESAELALKLSKKSLEEGNKKLRETEARLAEVCATPHSLLYLMEC